MAQQTRTKVKIVSFAEIYSRALLQSLPSNYRGGTVMLQSQRESCSCRTCCSGFVTEEQSRSLLFAKTLWASQCLFFLSVAQYSLIGTDERGGGGRRC
ncbi:unnamed protein product [Brassica oleracea var. botrytis]